MKYSINETPPENNNASGASRTDAIDFRRTPCTSYAQAALQKIASPRSDSRNTQAAANAGLI